MFLGSLGLERRSLLAENTPVGDGKDAEIELGVDEAAGCVARHIHTQLLEQPQDRAGLDRAWRVMVSGYEHDRRVGKTLPEPLKLPEREYDGVVGGPNRVEEISCHDHRVGPRGKDAVDGRTEGAGDIGFPLVDAARGLPVVLPDAEVGICYVGQFHGWRMGLKAVKSKKLRGGTAGRRDSGTATCRRDRPRA